MKYGEGVESNSRALLFAAQGLKFFSLAIRHREGRGSEGMNVLVAGIVCGIVGCLPQAFLFKRALKGNKGVRVALGLASVVASFVTLSLAILAAWVVAPGQTLAFGTVTVASFLLLWGVEAVRAWRAANGR